jgi:hypothetical protein
MFVVAPVFLFGCSSTTLAYKDTLELAFIKGPDVDLSLADIQQRSVPALYVRKNDTARAMLGQLENSETQQQWLSADSGLLVMQQGRFVKMLGFDQQLVGITVLQQDWLSRPVHQLHLGDKSQLITDWTAVQFRGMVSQIEIVALQQETLSYFGSEIVVTRVDEQVQFSSGEVVVNSFWFSSVNGMLLKSKQQPLPNWSVFELEYISDIAKNLSVIGKSSL